MDLGREGTICFSLFSRINNLSPSDSFVSFLYLCICLYFSRLFNISARASAELQPAEIPFSLISSDRARGTPGGPGQLASLRAAAGVCLAPGTGLGLPRHLITLEPWILRCRAPSCLSQTSQLSFSADHNTWAIVSVQDVPYIFSKYIFIFNHSPERGKCFSSTCILQPYYFGVELLWSRINRCTYFASSRCYHFDSMPVSVLLAERRRLGEPTRRRGLTICRNGTELSIGYCQPNHSPIHFRQRAGDKGLSVSEAKERERDDIFTV